MDAMYVALVLGLAGIVMALAVVCQRLQPGRGEV